MEVGRSWWTEEEEEEEGEEKEDEEEEDEGVEEEEEADAAMFTQAHSGIVEQPGLNLRSPRERIKLEVYGLVGPFRAL